MKLDTAKRRGKLVGTSKVLSAFTSFTQGLARYSIDIARRHSNRGKAKPTKIHQEGFTSLHVQQSWIFFIVVSQPQHSSQGPKKKYPFIAPRKVESDMQNLQLPANFCYTCASLVCCRSHAILPATQSTWPHEYILGGTLALYAMQCDSVSLKTSSRCTNFDCCPLADVSVPSNTEGPPFCHNPSPFLSLLALISVCSLGRSSSSVCGLIRLHRGGAPQALLPAQQHQPARAGH